MASRYLYLARHGDASDDGTLTPAGEQQSRQLGRRLAGVPILDIHHGPLPRTARTAEVVGASLPAALRHASDALGDYVPPVGDPTALPPVHARSLAPVTVADLHRGAALATAAVATHTGPAATETHELVITHSFLIAWLLRDALGAPDWRWVGLNAANAALTVILYRDDRPPALLAFNDMTHLTPELRWTGFPAELRV